MAGHVLILPVSPESSHTAQDQSRVYGLQYVGAETELFQDTGPKWVDDDVYMLGQRLDQRNTGLRLQVYCDG